MNEQALLDEWTEEEVAAYERRKRYQERKCQRDLGELEDALLAYRNQGRPISLEVAGELRWALAELEDARKCLALLLTP